MRETRIHVAGSRPIQAHFDMIHSEPHRIAFVDLRGQMLVADIVVTIGETPDGSAMREIRGTGSVELQPYDLPGLSEGRVYHFNAWHVIAEVGGDALLIARGTVTPAKSIGPSGAPGHVAFVTPDGELITDPAGTMYLEKNQ